MDTRTALLSQQPESYKLLLKRSLRLYRASFFRVIGLSLLLSCIVFIPGFFSYLIGENLFNNLPLLSVHRLWLLLINLGSLLFMIAIIWRMYCVIRNVHEPLIQDFKVGLHKLLNVFFATLIESIFCLGAIILVVLIQYGITHYFGVNNYDVAIICLLGVCFFAEAIFIAYVGTLFIFVIPIIAIENKHIFAAIKHSISLVWNHWFRVFSLQITPWLIYVLVLSILKSFDINIHFYFTEQAEITLTASIINMILLTLTLPWIASLLLIQLKDLELRKIISEK